jgi:transcriptional regulator with XRE-family HTH domain
MTEKAPSETPSDVVARRVKELRRQRDWSAARLAEECAKLGFPQLTESVIANIESGRRDESGRRRRDVTVNELDAFARTLGAAPADLLELEQRAASGRELLTWFRDAFLVEDLGNGRFVVHRPPQPEQEDSDG